MAEKVTTANMSEKVDQITKTDIMKEISTASLGAINVAMIGGIVGMGYAMFTGKSVTTHIIIGLMLGGLGGYLFNKRKTV